MANKNWERIYVAFTTNQKRLFQLNWKLPDSNPAVVVGLALRLEVGQPCYKAHNDPQVKIDNVQ